MLRIINKVRIYIAWCLINKFKFNKRYFFAKYIAPNTTTLIKGVKRKKVIFETPTISHIIYHQATVDNQCAINSLKSIFELNDISEKDEIIFYNNGSTFIIEKHIDVYKFEWFSNVFSKTNSPQKKSYTYGLNHLIPTAKAEKVIVWRTDYVYPSGLYKKYCELLLHKNFVSPYYVLIGSKLCDSNFLQKNWNKLQNWDLDYWKKVSTELSLYETQDPALFGISKKTWKKIGGLNHQLWGYGWQFAEFAAKIRIYLYPKEISYFKCNPPIHQTHEGTQMHHEMNSNTKRNEYEDGVKRFSEYLGGDKAFFIYKTKWILNSTIEKN